ncbi:MAG: aspartate kinase [Clostridia bacterium]|jgi:aspartate kinase
MLKVVKFGGSSLSDSTQVKKVFNIVTSDPSRKFVVVSAPGKRNSQDTKVTDMLIKLAEKALSNEDVTHQLNLILQRYHDISSGLGMTDSIVDTISQDLNNRLKSDKSVKERFLDNLKAAGEDNCAKLVAEYINSQGYKATYVSPKDAGLLLTSEFGNAQILPVSYKNLRVLNNYEGIVIFPGFFGYSVNQEVVTLPRGGSDVTGAILAASLDCDLYENFTDVDYIYTVNPNIVSNPIPIDHLTFKEMRELSYAGFSVFHEEALTPVYYKFTHVNIKNTNNPNAPGTMIHQQVNANRKHSITGISGDKGFSTISIRKYLMNREIGFGRKVLQMLEEESIPYEHSPSGIDDISIIVRTKYLNEQIEDRLICRIKNELKAEEVSIIHNQALVMIVGEKCLDDSNTLHKCSEALCEEGIVIKMLNQGSSKLSIMIGIADSDFEKAIRCLYNKFFTD